MPVLLDDPRRRRWRSTLLDEQLGRPRLDGCDFYGLSDLLDPAIQPSLAPADVDQQGGQDDQQDNGDH